MKSNMLSVVWCSTERPGSKGGCNEILTYGVVVHCSVFTGMYLKFFVVLLSECI